jgi:hypothetical protein
VRADIDVEIVLDMIYGPIFYRLLMGHSALDERFTDAVVEHVQRGISSSAPGKNLKRRR